jgi:hypothetical protein
VPSYAPTSTLPRPTTHRPSWPLLVVGSAMLVAGIAVMLTVGVWASRLGDPPGWQFDCRDTNPCVDLWIGARHHYWAVAAGAAVVALGGWLVVGAGMPGDRPAGDVPMTPTERPRTTVPTVLAHLLVMVVVGIGPTRIYWSPPVWLELLAVVAVVLLGLGLVGRRSRVPQQDRPERGRTLRRVVMLPVMNGAIALAFAASAWTITFSRPFTAGLVTATAAAATLAIAWWLRLGRQRSPRSAYFAAGAAVGMTVGAMAIIVVIPVIGWALVLLPFLSMPLVVLLGGLMVHAMDLSPTIDPAPTEGEAEDSRPVTSRHLPRPARPLQWSLVGLAVAVLLVMGIWAARPVPALSADAHLPVPPSPPIPAPSPSAVPEPDAHGPHAHGPDDASTPPPPPRVDPKGLPACTPSDLEISVGGWSAAMGNSGAMISATNRGARSCVLTGTPHLEITQGGKRIELKEEPLTGQDDGSAKARKHAGKVGLRPGDSASAPLFWPGYRNAADQKTPQQVTVRLTDDGEAVRATLEPMGEGTAPDEPAPAPFDLKVGVPGGAEIQIGHWQEDRAAG